MPKVKVIINFQKQSRIPFNVLVGAIHSRIKDSDLEIAIAYKAHQMATFLSEVEPEGKILVIKDSFEDMLRKFAMRLYEMSELNQKFEELEKMDKNIDH